MSNFNLTPTLELNKPAIINFKDQLMKVRLILCKYNRKYEKRHLIFYTKNSNAVYCSFPFISNFQKLMNFIFIENFNENFYNFIDLIKSDKCGINSNKSLSSFYAMNFFLKNKRSLRSETTNKQISQKY